MEEIPANGVDAQRYRVLIDHAPEPVFILDADAGKFVDFNENTKRFFQMSGEELLKKGIEDVSPTTVFGEESSTLIQRRIDHALQGGNQTFTWVHLNRAEEEILCEISLISLPPYDRKLLYGCIADLSERKHREAALKEREERLKLALNSSGLGSFDFNIKKGVLHWDDRMHEICGLPLDAEIDRNAHFFEIIHPEDQARVQQAFALHITSQSDETTYFDTYRIIVKGEIRHIESNGFLFRDERGEVRRVTGTLQDVTTRKQAEEQVRFQAALLENISDAVISVDPEHRILFWNQAAEELYGSESHRGNGAVIQEGRSNTIYI